MAFAHVTDCLVAVMVDEDWHASVRCERLERAALVHRGPRERGLAELARGHDRRDAEEDRAAHLVAPRRAATRARFATTAAAACADPE